MNYVVECNLKEQKLGRNKYTSMGFQNFGSANSVIVYLKLFSDYKDYVFDRWGRGDSDV